MKNDERMSLRLPPALRADVARLAKATGQEESALVRQALEVFLAESRQESPWFAKASALGIVGGGGARGPKDLSTNKKHFEGFGE